MVTEYQSQTSTPILYILASISHIHCPVHQQSLCIISDEGHKKCLDKINPKKVGRVEARTDESVEMNILGEVIYLISSRDEKGDDERLECLSGSGNLSPLMRMRNEMRITQQAVVGAIDHILSESKRQSTKSVNIYSTQTTADDLTTLYTVFSTPHPTEEFRRRKAKRGGKDFSQDLSDHLNKFLEGSLANMITPCRM